MEDSVLKFLDTHAGNVATLCGSTKFFAYYRDAARQLVNKGILVFECGSYGHSYHAHLPNSTSTLAKDTHFKKIEISDFIVVVTNKEGYTGSSTRSEIAFAEQLELPVILFSVDHFIERKVSGNFYDVEERFYPSFERFAKYNNLGYN